MDLWLLHFSNQTIATPWLDPIMAGLTLYGLRGLPLLGIGLVLFRQWRLGWTLLAAFAVALLITFTFYYLALRPRPEHVRLIVPKPAYPSYPSGHSATAFAVAALLALAYRRRWITTLALISAALIAYSRLYLGHHYPSDVLAGSVLGTAVGAAAYGLSLAAGDSKQRLRWLLWPQIALVFMVSQMAYLNLRPQNLMAWPFSDKVLHFLLFGLVVFWLNLWLEDRRMTFGRWALPVAVVLPFTLAMLDEGAQHFSPLRSMDVTDMASDLLGMYCFWWLSQKLFQGNQQPAATQPEPQM
jgi:undecaprenyl-diphosphatase